MGNIRRVVGFFLFSSVVSSAVACQQHPTAAGDQAAEKVMAGLQTAELNVEGTDCASCDVSIRRNLRQLSGVVEVRPGNDKRHVLVDFDPKLVSPEQIAHAVLTAGYEAELFVHPTSS
jgi:copper chaperone CopZ